MKKFLSYTQTALSLIAIVLSIVAICVTYPRSEDSGLDYIGIIVGILGALVAILVGWQLYNALNLKELVIQTEKAKNDAIEAKNQAETLLQNAQTSTKELYSKTEAISSTVKELSDYRERNLEHMQTLADAITGQQKVVNQSVELFNTMTSRIEEIDRQLDLKLDKNDLRPISKEDIDQIIG